MKRLFAGIFVMLSTVLCMSIAVHALDIPKAPSLDRPIVDQTGTLTSTQIDQLSQLILTSRGEKDYQIAVLMIPTLGLDSIEDYSLRVARSWGIGEKDKNNGILLLVAKNDHKLRIEVGSGLEGDLTDIQSGHIISDVITPKFKQDDFYGGIRDGIESIAALVQGKADPHPAPKTTGFETFLNILVNASFFILFGFVWIGSILARSKSWWGGGIVGGIIGGFFVLVSSLSVVSLIVFLPIILLGLLFDYFVSKNYYKRTASGSAPSWWAGGTTFGSGGSSGGSFGGGGFSGGGASGGW